MRKWLKPAALSLFALAIAATNFVAATVSAQTLTILHTFSSISTTPSGTNLDGANPGAGLVSLGNVLCGTTVSGGRYGAGAIFYLNPDGTGFNVSRPLTNSPDAGNPEADLIASGNLFYGATLGGGASGTGVVLTGQTNGSGSRIRNFATVDSDTATNAAGASPCAAVVLSGGVLYGTATAGGFFANGVIFSVTTNGVTSSVLHTFTVLDSNTGTNTDGATPWGGLVLSGNTLYGTASAGGAGGSGTLFSINTNGNNFTTLYSFTAMDPVAGTNTDGAIPYGGLVLSNGTLYGTTMAGGYGNSGTIFSIGTNGGNFTVLHQFTPVDANAKTNADGAKPVADLILSGGKLYGTTPAGGYGASGTVFSVTTNGSQFQSLYNFTALNPGNGTNTDGAIPDGDLLLSGNSLYGTTFAGGSGAAGTVFSLSLLLPPANLTNLVLNLDGSVTLFFLGSPGSTNVIQSTASLAPPAVWQNISTNVADAGGSWQFTDPITNHPPVQFYRSYSL